jgi:GH24 family phage-related lysozyme (muramidase)
MALGFLHNIKWGLPIWAWIVIAIVVIAIIIYLVYTYMHNETLNTVIDVGDLHYSQDLVDHIDASEGDELNVYTDLNGHETIGYGHNLDSIPYFSDGTPIPSTITQDQAVELEDDDLDTLETQVKKYLGGFAYTQGQWDAIIDFAWGGIGTFVGSTLYKRLTGQIASTDQDIAAEFGKWVYAGNPLTVQPGLVTRRQWESDRYLGNY